MDIKVSGAAFYQLRERGAVAVPALSQEEVAVLVAEAETLDLHRRDMVTQTGVTQDFFCYDFPHFSRDSAYLKLARYSECFLNRIFGRHGVLGAPVGFNDFSLQRYPVSKPGQEYAISPHVDYKSCINLIAVYLLKGNAAFYLCKDRSGAEPFNIMAKPGDLILMRGVGFNGELWRPFHFVGPVTEQRLSFGMRQTADGKLLNKVYADGGGDAKARP